MRNRLGLVVLTVLSTGLWLTPASSQERLDRGAYVPGEIIVKFARGVSSTRRGALIASRGAAVMRRFQELELDHVRLPPGLAVEAALADLRGNPEIAYAQPNFVYEAVAAPPPNDPFWLDNSLWGLQKIKAQETWQAFGAGNGSVIVADIDTGVMYTHPDLAANMWRNPGEIAGNSIDDDKNGYVDDVFGIDTVNHDSDPMDDKGHGTHTSGTIAAVGNNGIGVVGVNWNAKILACKFLDAAGSGNDAGAIECFNYITTLKNRGQNIRVSSNSWGGYRGSSPALALKEAMDAAGSAGILNICAAGNNGLNTDTSPFDPASLASPRVVSVASSEPSDDRSGFSNFGISSVDLAAPGSGIRSTIPGSDYGNSSGTSMATPHVAGVAALLASLDPTLSADNLKVLLMQNVDVLPQWAGVVASGGRLNAFKAASAISVPAPASGASAVFAGVDGTTQGDWPAHYGSAGYSIVSDTTSLPAYATVTPSGHNSWTWAASTTDLRALRRAVAPGRVAATWYGDTQFDITVGLTDGQPHQVTFYCFDYEAAARSQRLDVFDAATGALLDTRTVSNFGGGVYVIWTVTGSVRVRLTRLGNKNAVVSGVFIGGATSVNQTPTVALTSPAPAATFAPGASIPIAATANDPDGSIASVAFYADSVLLTTDTTSPYAFNWPTATIGSHTLTAVATDNAGQPTTSTPVMVSVTAPGGGGSAVFAGVDTTTQGDWLALYGSAGYSIVSDTTSLPPYASVTPSGHDSWTWAASTSDVRALRRAVAPGRVAATWYSSAQFDITVGLSDGQPHQVAIYGFDFESAGRSQRMDVFDAATGTLLDTRTISNFSGGQYVAWTITGNVRIRVTRLAGNNAVVSGVFIGGAASGNQAPTVALTSPDPGAAFTVGASIALAANAADLDGSVASVAFYADGVLLNTDATSPYSFSWPTASAGSHTLTAVATDNAGQPTTSAPVTISVTAPGGGASAVFAGVDATTQGDWTALYGSAGYAIVSDTTSLPSYATVTPSGHNSWTWAASTADPRALRRAVAAGRIAAVWYSDTQFDITVGLTDGQPHQVALYCLDYEAAGRSQRMEVFDAATGALLDTQTVSNLGGGLYVTWTVTGSVRVHLTRLGNKNAVVSGVFFGSASAGNLAPTVALTSPTPAATFASGAAIPIAANASDPDGTIASVAFYADSVLLNTDTLSPYAFSWSTATTGPHTVTAVATDNAGLPTTSAPVTISVSAPVGYQPPVIVPSTIALRADFVGTIGTGGNATSPVAAGPHLLLLKQLGWLYRWDGTTAQEILARATAPAAVVPVGDEAILNVAANAAGTSVFVMFTSTVAPAAIPAYTSPRFGANAWQVLYRYDFNGVALSNPQAIVAFHVGMYGHTGSGMVVLDDGTVLFATGDNGDSGEDGREFAQNPANHLSKILRINPSTSAVTLLAVGVRNVQRLFVNPNSGDPRLEFADLGGAIAEEFNSVRIADLLVGPVENFGWGRNAGDNLAREGTVYIDAGGAFTGHAPMPEAGFTQPVAQFGREGAALVAVTGSVSSSASFTNITALFGDLASGNVLAVLGAPGTPAQTVHRVSLVDSTLSPVTLAGLAGGRPDPRFFLFPDGTAGVLLERTGAFYRLTQVGQ